MQGDFSQVWAPVSGLGGTHIQTSWLRCIMTIYVQAFLIPFFLNLFCFSKWITLDGEFELFKMVELLPRVSLMSKDQSNLECGGLGNRRQTTLGLDGTWVGGPAIAPHFSTDTGLDSLVC